jgi:GTP-binding protein EngB required for normal cell division
VGESATLRVLQDSSELVDAAKDPGVCHHVDHFAVAETDYELGGDG